MDFSSFESELKGLGIEYVCQMDLKSASTFKIGGIAPLAVLPCRDEEVAAVFELAKRLSVKLHVVGRGSNTLFGDGALESVLLLTKRLNQINIDGEYICCGSGASLASVSALAAEHGLGGFEFASGIPGSVGGGIYMNAGAYGSAMGDVLCESLAYDTETGKYVRIYDHGFDYRKSIYMAREGLVCLWAKIKLFSSDTETVKGNISRLARERREKQPLEFPSCGSYFKRPLGSFAGKLIEECGLKGKRIGGAEVSEKHAGFIINRGNATAEDILALEETVRQTVLDATGILLEREVEYIES